MSSSGASSFRHPSVVLTQFDNLGRPLGTSLHAKCSVCSTWVDSGYSNKLEGTVCNTCSGECVEGSEDWTLKCDRCTAPLRSSVKRTNKEEVTCYYCKSGKPRKSSNANKQTTVLGGVWPPQSGQSSIAARAGPSHYSAHPTTTYGRSLSEAELSRVGAARLDAYINANPIGATATATPSQLTAYYRSMNQPQFATEVPENVTYYDRGLPRDVYDMLFG